LALLPSGVTQQMALAVAIASRLQAMIAAKAAALGGTAPAGPAPNSQPAPPAKPGPDTDAAVGNAANWATFGALGLGVLGGIAGFFVAGPVGAAAGAAEGAIVGGSLGAGIGAARELGGQHNYVDDALDKGADY